MLKINVINRVVDGVPILELEATDKKSIKILTQLHEELKNAQWIAISYKKADIYNVCGSSSDKQGVSSLCIPLALGGIGLKRDK